MRRVLVAVVLLVAVLVVADFAAAAAAESTVSRQMRDRLGLPEDPAVQFGGFSFLAQAATGRYGTVEMTVDRLPVGSLHTREIEVLLHDLRAPWSDLVGSGPTRLRFADAEAIVTIGSGDVRRMLPDVSDLTITPIDANAIDDVILDGGDPTLRGIDPRNAARFDATTTVRGRDTQVQVLATMQVTGDGLIRITPRDVRAADENETLPASTEASLTKAFSLLIDPGALPFKVTPTRLRVDEDDKGKLVLSGQVKDLVVGDGERSTSAQS